MHVFPKSSTQIFEHALRCLCIDVICVAFNFRIGFYRYYIFSLACSIYVFSWIAWYHYRQTANSIGDYMLMLFDVCERAIRKTSKRIHWFFYWRCVAKRSWDGKCSPQTSIAARQESLQNVHCWETWIVQIGRPVTGDASMHQRSVEGMDEDARVYTRVKESTQKWLVTKSPFLNELA